MSAPKPPTPKKVNPYEGLTSDPEFAKAAEELGYTSVNKDHEVAAVKEYMLKSTIEDERRDKAFRKAEKQLYKDGTLEYAEGTKGKQGRIDSSDTEWELQKIYDQMYDNEQAKADKAYEKNLKQQAKQYQQQQKKAANQAKKQANQQMKQQQKQQDKMFKQQQKMMDEMMNQPIYNPKQAALPKIQERPKTPDPMPVAPAPAPQMSIPTAPAPEMVSMGNPMGVVKQSKSARSRSRGRTRGTSSLT